MVGVSSSIQVFFGFLERRINFAKPLKRASFLEKVLCLPLLVAETAKVKVLF